MEAFKLPYTVRQKILDYFGEVVIKHVRDRVLEQSMVKATYTTVNRLYLEKYKNLSDLSDIQKESVCDLLSDTITGTIFEFLDMFEANKDKMQLNIIKDGQKYDMADISEKMGSEIACYEDDGWIQQFSEIGRFVL